MINVDDDTVVTIYLLTITHNSYQSNYLIDQHQEKSHSLIHSLIRFVTPLVWDHLITSYLNQRISLMPVLHVEPSVALRSVF